MNNYIDLSKLAISSQDEDNTYFGLDENGNVVRTKIAVGGDGGSGFVDLSDYYTKDEIDRKIEDIENGDVDLSDYYTKKEVDDKIDGIDIPEVDLSNYYTKTQVDKKIDNIDIPEVDLTGYATENWVKNQGYLDGIPSDYVTETELANKKYATTTQLNSKQDSLVSGKNIKTINGQSIIGGGNITIVGGDGDVDLTGYYTKGEVDDLIDNIDLSEYVKNTEFIGVAQQVTANQANIINQGSEINNIDGRLTNVEKDYIKSSDVDLTGYAKSSDLIPIYQNITNLQGQVQTLDSNKQDVLVSGSNIKTVNGESILGNGNIVIESGNVDAGIIILEAPEDYDNDPYESSYRKLHNADCIQKIKNGSVTVAYLKYKSNTDMYIYLPMAYGWENFGSYGYLTGVVKYWYFGSLHYDYFAVDMDDNGNAIKFEVQPMDVGSGGGQDSNNPIIFYSFDEWDLKSGIEYFNNGYYVQWYLGVDSKDEIIMVAITDVDAADGSVYGWRTYGDKTYRVKIYVGGYQEIEMPTMNDVDTKIGDINAILETI